jgi:hypothetical protein
MGSDEDSIRRMFNAYVEAFQALEPRSVAIYLDAPFMFIGPQGVRVLRDFAEIESFLAGIMAQLRAQDYARSTIADIRVNRMSASNALVSVRRARYRTDGSELEKLGETYTLRKVEGNWRIVAAMVHDPGAIVALAPAQ